MKRILILAVLIVLAGTMVCAAPSGTLKIAGSNTVLPLSQLWAEKFMAKYPDVSISVSGNGTGTGFSGLLNGSCHLANASRLAKKKEVDAAKTRNMQLVATKIAKDGLAIVVHRSNSLTNIDMAQLAGIYSGRITNWKQVGGKSSGKIVVIGRDSSSGTFGYFQEVVLNNSPYTREMLGLASTKAIVRAVSQSKDAIGYVGIAYARNSSESGNLNVLSVSRKPGSPGIPPTDKTVENGTYPLFRYLMTYTMGKPRGLAGEFLKYCTSKECQSLVHESGYLPL